MTNKRFFYFILTLTVFAFLFFSYKKSTQNYVLLKIGHRGAFGYEPQNTLRSFKKALDLGVDAVEMDVHKCKTGEIVVIHDKTVDATTDGKGAVTELTLDELKRLDAGKGEEIPTLEQALDLVNRKAKVIIELKGKDEFIPTAEVINEYVKNRGWKYKDFLVISYDLDKLYKIRDFSPKLRLGLLFEKLPENDDELDLKNVDYIVLNFEYITPSIIKKIHKKGIKIIVYTVNDEKNITLMKRFKVDGIVSNYPNRI